MNLSSSHFDTINVGLIITDSRNPAFILNDKHTSRKRKMCFVLGQLWCWGLVILILLICIFGITIKIALDSKHLKLLILVERDEWGAKPVQSGLKEVQIPAQRIILTHSEDKVESCTTKVCDKIC